MPKARDPPKYGMLTLRQKKELFKMYDGKKTKNCQLARYFGVSSSAIGKLLKNRSKIETEIAESPNLDVKRTKTRYPEVNAVVWDWFEKCRKKNKPLSGVVIKAKASSVADALKINRFVASDGWLRKFNTRNGIRNKLLSGKSQSADKEAGGTFKDSIPSISAKEPKSMQKDDSGDSELSFPELCEFEEQDFFDEDETAEMSSLGSHSLVGRTEEVKRTASIKERVKLSNMDWRVLPEIRCSTCSSFMGSVQKECCIKSCNYFADRAFIPTDALCKCDFSQQGFGNGPYRQNACPHTRATASLPEFLDFYSDGQKDWKVVTRVGLPVRSIFGPLVAPDQAASSCFGCKYYFESEPYVWTGLDLSSDDSCNWMKFVRDANDHTDQNLASFQFDGEIYFVTIKDISFGEELRIRYADNYAVDIARVILHNRLPAKKSAANFYTVQSAMEFEKELKIGSIVSPNPKSREDLKNSKERNFPENQFPTGEILLHSDIVETQMQVDSSEEPTRRCLDVPNRAPEKIVKESKKRKRADHPPSVDETTFLHSGIPETELDLSEGIIEIDEVLNTKNLVDKANSDSLSPLPEKFTRKSKRNTAVVDLESAEGFTNTRTSSIGSIKRPAKRLQCEQCDYSVSRSHAALFERHQLIHSEGFVVREWECNKCGAKFGTNKLLEQHKKEEHKKPEKLIQRGPISCDQCDYAGKSIGALKNHKYRSHDPEGILATRKVARDVARDRKCIFCLIDLKSTKDASHHYQSIHCTDGKYSCRICQKSFIGVHKVAQHLRTVHGPKSCICGVCGKAFINKTSLSGHELSHQTADLKCPHCPLEFKRDSALQVHIQRIHVDPVPSNCTKKRQKVRIAASDNYAACFYKCRQCKLGFLQRHAFISHLESRHPGFSKLDIPELNLPMRKVTRYRCEVCLYRLLSEELAVRHLKNAHPEIEPDEEKYIKKYSGENHWCEMCDVPFSGPRDLLKHAEKEHPEYHQILMPSNKV